MNKNLVVKDNALINASYSLELVEQRLIMLSIIEARRTKQEIVSSEFLTIYADRYIDEFGVHRNVAYQALKDACRHLFERRFTYQKLTAKGNREIVTSRWVQSISYVENEAIVRIKFSDDVAPLIYNLEKNFTSYELEQVAQLNSKYAVRLYEVVIAWRSAGKTPMITIDELRNRLGVLDDEYIELKNLKARVIDFSIKQINEKTEISISYEQHKNGRKIIGFTFTIKQKSLSQNTDAEIDALFVGLTSPEIDAIKEQVRNTIESKNITDPKHIQNLYKKAVKEGWGLDDANPSPSDDLFSAENDKKRKKAQQKHELKLKQQQLEFDRLVALYEQSDDDFKNFIADKMRQQLKDANKSGMIAYLEDKINLGQAYYTDRHLKADFMSVMSALNLI